MLHVLLLYIVAFISHVFLTPVYITAQTSPLLMTFLTFTVVDMLVLEKFERFEM